MTKKPTYEELEQKVQELEKQAVEHRQMYNTLTPEAVELNLSNMTLENAHLVDGRYSIKDLIDIENLRKTLEKFFQATGFVTSLVEYPSQDILIATGWRDICTKFHRAFPGSLKNCKNSNIYLTEKLKELKELNMRPCENGLVDGATPIVIKGVHLASLFTGQVFFEKPDMEWFKKQAEIYGYDFDAYFEALSKVPVVSEDQFKNALSFLNRLAVTIAETGFNNLGLSEKSSKLEEEITERKQLEESLRESQEKFKLHFDNASDVIFSVDSNFRILDVSPSVEKILGYKPNELIAHSFQDLNLLAKDSIELAFTDTIKVLSGETISSSVYEFVAKDGTRRFGEVSGAPFFKNRKIVGVVSIARDITERKEAEEALQAKREFLDRVIDQSPFATWISDAEGTLQLANPALKRFLNLTDEQLVDKYNVLKDPLIEQQGLMPLIRTVYEKGNTIKFNADWNGEDIPTMDLKGSKSVSIEATMFPIHDPEGGLTNVVLTWIDVSKRKRAEETLKESEAFLKTMIDAIPTPVFYKDRDGRYLGFNKAFERFFGETRERLIGKSVFDINPPELAEIYKAQDKKLFDNGGTQRYESQWKNTNGELRNFIFNKAAFTDSKGIITGLIGVLVDITDRKRIEEERKRLEDQLRQSQKMEAIGTLAGGIAHDFNNILGIILGNTELAMDDVPEWNLARQNLNEVKKGCLRAKEVVRQILSFSRKTETEQKPLNLAPVVTESLKLLRASIPTSIDIRQNISTDIDDILGDPTQIHQIMINLCTNAAHAMEKDGGTLKVTLEHTEIDEDTASQHPVLNPGPYVYLRVSDTGDGISSEMIDRIFDPYFTTKDVGKGTGLGLSVVHGIVKSHHGRISVESSAGKGTTFKILFPAIEKQIGEKPKKLEELATGQERILFVDDEDAMVSLNQQRLERLGYKVTGKTDPSETLEFFRSDPNQFDLVITDMTMPRMTGDKLAQEILKIRSDIPIIICTGYSNRISEAKAQELGVRKYIEKPIEMGNLARSVREVLDGQ